MRREIQAGIDPTVTAGTDLTYQEFEVSKELLLSLFGAAIGNKILEKPTRHQLPGKHYRGKHSRGANPAGSKLWRKFAGKNNEA